MSSILTITMVIILFFACKNENKEINILKNEAEEGVEYAMVIHGGAGTILKKNMTPKKEAAYLQKLNEALDAGEAILKKGGSSIDAVEKTIMILENSPLFNAGKGAVFTNAGINELDASIMTGKDQNAGAVGGVTTIKNPILAARAVLEKSDHVMLTGKGAEAFSKSVGIETVEPSYFHTENRMKSLERAKKKEMGTGSIDYPDYKFGTVGCVALDKNGNITAGTSTGGMTNKKYNRIGDSPIIGAGTYANNATCGVSSTGHGEYFIRYAVAHDISALMEYKNMSLAEAAEYVVNKKLVEKGGSGGVIALDAKGNVSMPFNTKGMYRGYAKPGERVVEIYK
ncbi:MAG: isoaspartyl peptidase/L-asparaginase [Bacteroidota bacterium]